jgi:hypothetical protein
MNRRYYERRLSRIKLQSVVGDVVILASIGFVGAGLWFVPSNAKVEQISKYVALLATLVSGWQLLGKPGEVLATFEARVAFFEQLDHGLEELVVRIRTGQADETVLAEMQRLKRAASQVHLRRVEATEDQELLREAQEQTLREIPTNYFG